MIKKSWRPLVDKSLGNIEDIYPMSDIAKGMIYHSLKDDSAYVYHNQMVFYIQDREFDIDILEKALGLMTQKHHILRTGFKMDDFEEPVQIVYKKYQPGLQHYHLPHMEKRQQEEYIKEILAADRRQTFDIARTEPLWRVKTFALDDTNICFIWIGHHAIMDGWSTALLMTELYNTYVKLKKEPQFVPDPLESTYKDFVIEQLLRKKRTGAVEFWEKELDGYNRFNFRAAGSSDEKKKVGKKRRKFKLDAAVLDKIKAAAINYNTSLRNLCFAAYIYMLNMVSYESDIVVGLIINNRPVCQDGDKIIGCFLNTIPVRIKIPGRLKWKDYIKLVDDKLLELTKYNRLSFFEIVESIAEKSRDENPIVDTIFNFVDYFVVKRMNREILDINSPQDTDGVLNVESSGDSNTMFDVSLDATFGNLEITAYYSNLLDDRLVQSLLYYFEAILNKLIYTPDSLAKKEELIPGEEKQKLLYSFNAAQTGYPKHTTIHQLFENQAAKTPGKIALVEPFPGRYIQLSYKELNLKSNQLARRLRNRGVKANTFVGLMVPNSIDLVLGMLGIIKAGGAYLPLDANYPETRINLMLKDSGVMFIITGESRVKNLEGLHVTRSGIEGLDRYGSADLETITDGDDLFYIIYTSGSVGVPKGVLVKHKGFINLVYSHRAVFREDSGSRMSQVANPGFDAMAFEVWPCLLNGAALYIADHHIRMNPTAVKKWLIRHEITISFQPTAMTELLISEQWPEKGTRLKALRAAGDKLKRYPRPGCPFKVYNLYGPTEDTVWTTWTELAPNPGEEGVPPIGKPIANHRVYILDAHLRLQPIGSAGELCIGGDGVAKGYLNQVELTAEKFVYLPGLTQCRLFRTGDLARWLPNGNIDFSGRIDNQVKIRGFRIELGEIEHQLLRHRAIKEAAVILKENQSGDKYICAYIASEQEFTPPQLKRYLSGYLPNYMIPSYFKRLEAIPLTPNGKVDRKALPQPDTKRDGEYFSPGNPIEEKIVEIWTDVLGINKDNLGFDPDFFELGGHSLTAVKLLSRLQKEFNVKLKLSEIYKYPRIRELGNFLKSAETKGFVPINPLEKKEYYNLSSAQKRLYSFQEINPQSIVYNIPQLLVLQYNLEREKLQEVFKILINRHESLRTSFILIDEQPVQRVHSQVEFEVKYNDPATGNKPGAYLSSGFIRPFDLSHAPLLRVVLIKENNKKHIMVVDMHHIISDAASAAVLEKDFWELYRGEVLSPLRLQYRDFSGWQNSEMGKENLKQQEVYWLKNFTKEVPVLNLPYDYPRPKIKGFEGSRLNFEIDKKNTQEIKHLASQQNTTVYTVMLAIYYILLAKLSKNEDIVVGTVIEGRTHPDLEKIVGMFVNILALRNFPTRGKTFRTFLNEVRNRVIQAFENQDFQFDNLIERLNVKRRTDRNPLLDVAFQLWEQEQKGTRENHREYSNEIKPGENQFSKVDMTFHGIYTPGGLLFTVEYSIKLFKEKTIQGFINYYNEIVSAVLTNPDIEIGNIELISRAKSQQIVSGIKERNKELNVEFQV